MKWLTTLALTALTLLGCEMGKPIEINFASLPPGAFNEFVNNWDEELSSLMVAVVGSEDKYHQVFGTAAFGYGATDEQPAQQANSDYFSNTMLVSVAEVLPAPVDEMSPVSIYSVEGHAGVLSIYYKVLAPTQHTSYRVNAYSNVALAKQDFHCIKVFRDDKLVLEKALTNGELYFPVESK